MYLIDTNTFSDAHKGVPEPVRWLTSIDPTQVFISVITLGEIERGIELIRSSRPTKAAQLEQWLAALRAENATRILPITDAVALEWGRISARQRRMDADGLILATAKVHDLIVATRNVSDFSDAGVRVVNPWQD